MDEEDLAEQAEAQKLQTNEDFAGFGTTSEEAARRGKFVDLFKPQGETMGVKLLRRMGWRDGQGIGPKVKRKARFQEDEEEADGAEHAFAPDDTPLIAAGRKEDRKGMGFGGEEGVNGSSKSSAPVKDEDEEDGTSMGPPRKPAKHKVSSKPQKGGFGMGVLNDTGSDDEDPYEMGPRVSYNKVTGGDKKRAKTKGAPTKPSAPSANPLVGSKPVFKPQKFSSVSSTTGFRKCHDGRLPLDGFLLSEPLQSLSISEDSEQYPIPTIPSGWTSSKTTSTPQANSSHKSTAEAAKASTLDPKARAAMLGETPLPGKSIFDYVTPAARDRLAAASGRTDLPQGRGEAPPKASTNSTSPSTSTTTPNNLDTPTALAALSRSTSGWTPYTEDPPKRDRYRTFLEFSAGLRDTQPARPSDLSNQIWTNELREFAHAARVFKPVTGAMASRFQSSSVGAQSSSQSPQLNTQAQTAGDGNGAGAHMIHKPKPKDPAEEAASMGMYGPLTRQVLIFYPSRLVCKRFGVKVPGHVMSGNEGRGAHGADDVAKSRGGGGGGLRMLVAGGEGMGGDRVEGSEGVEQGKGKGKAETAAQKLLGMGMRSFTRGPTEHAAKVGDQAQSSEGLRPASMAGWEGSGKEPGVVDVSKEMDVEMGVDAEKNEALEAKRAGEELFRSVFGDEDDD